MRRSVFLLSPVERPASVCDDDTTAPPDETGMLMQKYTRWQGVTAPAAIGVVPTVTP